jgi:hypothetical protein
MERRACWVELTGRRFLRPRGQVGGGSPRFDVASRARLAFSVAFALAF